MTTTTDEQPQTETEPAVEPEKTQQERDRLMSQAYGAAQKDLREKHKDEFNRYYQKQCADRGIEWTPRKSKQEQALDTVMDLLTEYPDITEALVERLAAQAEGAQEQQGEGE